MLKNHTGNNLWTGGRTGVTSLLDHHLESETLAKYKSQDIKNLNFIANTLRKKS